MKSYRTQFRRHPRRSSLRGFRAITPTGLPWKTSALSSPCICAEIAIGIIRSLQLAGDFFTRIAYRETRSRKARSRGSFSNRVRARSRRELFIRYSSLSTRAHALAPWFTTSRIYYGYMSKNVLLPHSRISIVSVNEYKSLRDETRSLPPVSFSPSVAQSSLLDVPSVKGHDLR